MKKKYCSKWTKNRNCYSMLSTINDFWVMHCGKQENICGYYIDGKLYCTQCSNRKYLQNLELDDLLLEEEVYLSDKKYFCDICKKMIN
jgi:hypothetical protein